MNEGDKENWLIHSHGFNMDERAASQGTAFRTGQFGQLSHMPESDSGLSNGSIPFWLQMASSTHIPPVITTLPNHSMTSNGSARHT